MCPFFENDLPRSSNEQNLERESIAALQDILPVKDFVFRDERITDAGVDGSLEVLQSGMHTNARAQVQLKSTSVDKPKNDGSRSLSVSTDNLRYLINGGFALYILYVKSTGKLWSTWAHDELDRLEEQNPTWLQQDEVTLQFRSQLDTTTIAQIHKKIIDNAQLSANIKDALRNKPFAHTQISVDLQKLVVTDSHTAYEAIKQYGVDLVSDNKLDDVFRYHSLLDTTSKSDAFVELVMSYASYVRGQYLEGRAYIGRASLKAGQLSDDDRKFMSYLKDGCDFQLSRISAQEYAKRLKTAAENDDTISGIYMYHAYLRYAFLHETDQEKREILLQELKALLAKLNAFPACPTSTKLQVYNSLLFLEGAKAAYSLSDALAVIFFNRSSQSEGIRQIPFIVKELINPLLEEADQVFRQAERLRMSRLLADIICTRSQLRILMLGNLALINNLAQIPENPLPGYDEAKHDIEIAAALYKAEDNTDGWLRARLLLSRLLELAGKREEAQSVADETLPYIDALGLAQMDDPAKAMAAGDTSFAAAIDQIVQLRSLTPDEILALYIDSDADYMAEVELVATGLPETSLPALCVKWHSMVAAAKARLNGRIEQLN